ncbi:benenodin family lasso peptide [Xanthomonas arboricola]|nr:benenodin family lasso peptide [Xanthomonas arboricola]
MDTSNNDAHTTTFGQDLIMLGIASLDTQGGPLAGEEMGGSTTLGISQD